MTDRISIRPRLSRLRSYSAVWSVLYLAETSLQLLCTSGVFMPRCLLYACIESYVRNNFTTRDGRAVNFSAKLLQHQLVASLALEQTRDRYLGLFGMMMTPC